MKFEKNDKAGWDRIYCSVAGKPLPWERENTHTGKASVIKCVLNFKPGTLGLEVGCGRGHNIRWLKSLGYNVHGIEISKSAVQQSDLSNICVGNCLALPYVENLFDFVIDVGCMQHVRRKHRGQYANEIRRVLKPGGLLGVSCFSDEDYYSTKQKWGLSKYGLYISYSDPLELQKLFRNGFQLIYLDKTSWSSSLGHPHKALNVVTRKRE